MTTIEIENKKRIKITANEIYEIVFNDFIQGFDILLMNEANVVMKPINSLNVEYTITLDDLEGYLLNSFCRGISLYEMKQFESILVISDKDIELQFLNIR